MCVRRWREAATRADAVRAEAEAEVAAAKSEAARATAAAEDARAAADAARTRGGEMQAAFASVLAALDSAVAGAFAPNTAPGDKDAAGAAAPPVPDFAALQPASLAPPTGKAIHSHDTFPLNLRLDRGKCLILIGGERYDRRVKARICGVNRRALPAGHTLDHGIAGGGDGFVDDHGDNDGDPTTSDVDGDNVVGGGGEMIDENEGDVSSARKQLDYADDDDEDGNENGNGNRNGNRNRNTRGGRRGRSSVTAAAAEARGVWAARQLSARVGTVVWERVCAEEESRLAKENAAAAEENAAAAEDAAAAAAAAREEATTRAAAAEASAASASKLAAAAQNEAEEARTKVREEGQRLLDTAEAARAEAAASVAAANEAGSRPLFAPQL